MATFTLARCRDTDSDIPGCRVHPDQKVFFLSTYRDGQLDLDRVPVPVDSMEAAFEDDDGFVLLHGRDFRDVLLTHVRNDGSVSARSVLLPLAYHYLQTRADQVYTGLTLGASRYAVVYSMLTPGGPQSRETRFAVFRLRE